MQGGLLDKHKKRGKKERKKHPQSLCQDGNWLMFLQFEPG